MGGEDGGGGQRTMHDAMAGARCRCSIDEAPDSCPDTNCWAMPVPIAVMTNAADNDHGGICYTNELDGDRGCGWRCMMLVAVGHSWCKRSVLHS